jgi:peroxiredoxin
MGIIVILIAVNACKKTDDNSPNEGETGTKVGQIAPNFTLPDKSGNNISLDDYSNQYVVIDFWASWCHFCRDENPQLVSLYSKYKNKGVEIIGVSVDTNKNDWLNAVADDNIEYVQISDLLGFESPVANTYGVINIPRMVLVHTSGTILLITGRASDIESYLEHRLN